MAAEQPPEEPGRRPRRGWWIAAGLLALLLVVGLVVLWVQAPALYGRGDAAKTAGAPGLPALIAGQAGGAPKEDPSLL